MFSAIPLDLAEMTVRSFFLLIRQKRKLHRLEGKPQRSDREPQQTASNIRILSTVEINSEEDLSDIRKYVKPMGSKENGQDHEKFFTLLFRGFGKKQE